MKKFRPSPGDRRYSRKQPGANVLEDNSRYDINAQDAKLAEITRSWGMDPDFGLAIGADGKLTINTQDESDGVPYTGPKVTPHSDSVPTVRSSDPMPGVGKGQ